ncbi:MAG: hypothetical protein J6T20_08530 [Treponema sp.]|nr:hypothetical protein [Treponema sp.]
MKKQLKTLFATLSFSLIFMGCGLNTLQVPKEVKLKTKAKYEFSVLDFDTSKENSSFKLSEYLDIGKMLEEKAGAGTGSGSGTSTFNIYKYNPASDYQQFLVHMSLPETEFDMSETFKDMDFSNAMSGFDFNKKFTVPNMNKTETQEIDMSSIRTSLNNVVTCIGTTDTEEFEISFENFNTVTYGDNSYFVVQEYLSSVIPNDATVTLKGDGWTKTATFADGEAELDISGKTIKNTGMKLSFTGTTGADFAVTVKDGSTINSIKGVTVTGDSTINVAPVTFTFDLPDPVVFCAIDEGSINISIPTPANWTDVIDDFTITISGDLQKHNGDPITCTKAGDNSNNLADTDFPGGDITAETQVTIVLSNDNIDFTKPLNAVITIDLRKIASAKIKMDAGFETEINGSQPVSSDITDVIDRVKFLPSGFDVTAKNTLPSGNDIDLQFDSVFLGMSGDGEDVKKTIVAGGTSAQATTLRFKGTGPLIKFVDDGEGTKVTTMNVHGQIGLPGFDDSTSVKTFEVTNVVPGTEYELDLKITPFIDWEYADVKLPASVTNGYSNKMSVGINKKTLFESAGSENFADKLDINELPLYIFVAMPDTVFTDLEFEGKIKSFYGNDNSGTITPVSSPKETWLLGDGSNFEDLNFTPLPVLQQNAAGEVLKINANAFPTAISLASAINDPADEGSLCIEYNIKPKSGVSGDAIRVTKETIEQLKLNGKAASIKIDIVILLSMDFNVNSDLEIDIMKMMKKDDPTIDLLGRTEQPDISSYETYLDLLNSATIRIDNMKIPIIGEAPELSIDAYGEGPVKKEIKNGGSYALKLKPKKLMQTYPLHPEIKIKFKQNDNVKLLKKLDVGGKIVLNIDAQGEIPIYPFNAQD